MTVNDRRRYTLWLALIALALGTALRFIYLGQRELWYDEVLSLLLATGQRLSYQTPEPLPQPLADYAALLQIPDEPGIVAAALTLKHLLQGLLGTEPHPPGFFVAQHVWLRLWGPSETALRSLNMLISLATMALAYGLGRSLHQRSTGLMLAALLALNPFFLFHALNLRMYAPIGFWAVLGSWALVECLRPNPAKFWSGGFVLAVTGGLMTSYLMVYWLIGAGVIVLLLDRRALTGHALRFGAGLLLTLPWLAWGLRQQLRNVDLDRFASELTGLAALWRHGQDGLQTLGIHLLLGDWAARLPTALITLSGGGAALGLALASLYLAQQKAYRWLILGWGLGLVPLACALGADAIAGKFTLAWGLGRSVIFVLPGLLLLLTLALQRLPWPWQPVVFGGLLLAYAGLSLGDLALHQRQTFRTAARLMHQSPAAPTLIVLNSNAWGHVLRAAYYLGSPLSPAPPVDLLAAPPASLPQALAAQLDQPALPYAQILWLQAERPLWGAPETPAQAAALEAATQALIVRQFRPLQQQSLRGTMDLDNFTLRLYQRQNGLSPPP